jgi:DNA-binding GntR family transcriptional regulator
MSSPTAIIRPTPLREQAQVIIREAVVSGEIGPESIFSATALAKKLGISVSPVREAMMALVNEGILEPVRNRGFRLVPMTDDELDELADIRRLLEVPATVRLASIDVSALREPAEAAMEEARRAARGGRIRDFLIHERHVHELFLVHGGGPRLARFALGLRDQERLGAVARQPAEKLVAIVDELHRILDAAQAGDAALVREEMSRHLDHVRKDLAGPGSEPGADRLEPLVEPGPYPDSSSSGHAGGS